jgi:class 3 adenylate cyclase/tetratricopeptide (TPR) repeat protein
LDSIDEQVTQLRAAIAAQEELRGTLPDAVIDAIIATLREKLDGLEAQTQAIQQRKQATVLFADVSGFTAISETMDAEIVAGVMNDLWRLVDQAILDCGGRIDKHIGDAVMAVWGAVLAREDDPERAVRAALAMQEAVGTFCATHHVPLAMRIGVNTGPVVFGQVGTTGEYTAMGDTVNMASRLESAAPAGGILIAHSTYRHIRGVFDVQPLDRVPIKGKAEPVRCYVILRAKPRAFRTTTRGVEGVETRTVGRDAELLTLQNAFVDVVEDYQAQIVVVTGEAGVGKSRLLYEFENWLELRPERISFHKGRAVPTAQRTRLGLFRDQFALRFDILESDRAEVALEKFRGGMQPTLDADRADVVGHWLGFDFAGSPAVARLAGRPEFALTAQAYLIRYIRDLTRDRPVVIFFEDIHWADDASLELILELASALPDGRLLIVCLARPILYERLPNWSEGHPAVTRLAIKPLSRRFTRELVDEILQRAPAIPDTLRTMLVDNAEGNPFYVEEMVKMLIDEEIITPRDGEWSLDADRLKALRVPSTLTGILQARLDSLPREERETLQRSSVVGRLFWDDAVADLAGSERDAIRPVLDSVRRRELILHRHRSSFSGVEEYAFRHNLLREVVYETVLLRARRDYHAQVARWIEQHAGGRLGEFLSLIAEHYALAGQNNQAATYFEMAGEQAMSAGTYRVARAAFEQALALREAAGEPAETTAETQVRLGAACWQLGDYQAARQFLEQGLEGARRGHDGRVEALGLYYLGQTLSSLGDFAAAKALFEQALPIARPLGGETLIQVLFGLGGNAWRTGDLEAAEAYTLEDLSLARTQGLVALEAQAINMLGLIAGVRADLETEQACYEESLALSRQIGDLFREAVALANLGVIAILRQSYPEAIRYLESCLDMFNDLGRLESVALNLGNLATIYLQTGDLETARRHVREMLRLSAQLGAPPQILFAVMNWAEILVAEGDYHKGLSLLGLIRDHPAHEYQMLQEIERIIQSTPLSQAEREEALATGAALDLDAVIAEILAEKA